MKFLEGTHLDSEYIQTALSRVTELPFIKLILSVMSVGVAWIFNGDLHALYAITALVTLDTITGFMCGVKAKDIDSRVFYRVAVKFTVYVVMIVSGRVADKVMVKPIIAPMLDTFLIITELISILENCGNLGVPVPEFITDRLKKIRDKK